MLKAKASWKFKLSWESTVEITQQAQRAHFPPSCLSFAKLNIDLMARSENISRDELQTSISGMSFAAKTSIDMSWKIAKFFVFCFMLRGAWCVFDDERKSFSSCFASTWKPQRDDMNMNRSGFLGILKICLRPHAISRRTLLHVGREDYFTTCCWTVLISFEEDLSVKIILDMDYFNGWFVGMNICFLIDKTTLRILSIAKFLSLNCWDSKFPRLLFSELLWFGLDSFFINPKSEQP